MKMKYLEGIKGINEMFMNSSSINSKTSGAVGGLVVELD